MSSASILGRSARRFAVAEAFPNLLRRLPSLVVLLLVASVGAFLLAAFMISVGLYISRALLSVEQISHADASVPTWLASHRTPLFMNASYVGNMLAAPWVVAPIVGVTVAALALARRWRRAIFLILAVLVEIWAYTLSNAFVHWQNGAGVGQGGFPWLSIPAGRVATAVAVYGALAYLLTAEFRRRRIRSAVWSLAAVVSLVVSASVLYRGEHRLVDVAGGVAMGAGALFVVMIAEYVAGAATELRRSRRAQAAT
jgi:hypothetical protein